MSYSAEGIVLLEGLDAIRKRPGLYAGDLSRPALANELLTEAMCISAYDALGGCCTLVEVDVLGPSRVVIRDDGPGWPLDPTSDGSPWAHEAMTRLGACAAHKEPRARHELCAIGLAVINALSESVDLTVSTEAATWSQSYARGRTVGSVGPVQAGPIGRPGTRIDITLDRSILPGVAIDASSLAAHLAARRWPLRYLVRDSAGTVWEVPDPTGPTP